MSLLLYSSRIAQASRVPFGFQAVEEIDELNDSKNVSKEDEHWPWSKKKPAFSSRNSQMNPMMAHAKLDCVAVGNFRETSRCDRHQVEEKHDEQGTSLSR